MSMLNGQWVNTYQHPDGYFFVGGAHSTRDAAVRVARRACRDGRKLVGRGRVKINRVNPTRLSDVHASHSVVDDGHGISDPRCTKCGRYVYDTNGFMLRQPCTG